MDGLQKMGGAAALAFVLLHTLLTLATGQIG